ncbi:uncharacterized protein LOC117221754 [Megalopta genalis]|uniref:uncharacterized protein LOC117221754 n=1 Tax=Megalopta genalis TaxID=115081 RepID=UPI003FD2AE14
MANTSALPRSSAGLCPPNDFDGIIGRIDSLRLSCETSPKIADRDEPADRKKKWNISLDNENNDEKKDPDDNGNEEDADRTDQLIARGPMKSQFLSGIRDRPYDWSTDRQPNLQAPRSNEAYLFDYEETAVQILRDKESCERLNACLDQLQTNARTILDHFSVDGIERSSAIQDANADFAFESACEDDDTALLEKLLRGDFQSAQCYPSGSPMTTTSVATPSQDSPLVSGSESRDSNCTSSTEYPWTQKRLNQAQSPLGSPRIVPVKTYAHSQLTQDLPNSCCSLSPCSTSPSFSSSSNQSYGDPCSPIGYRFVNGILGSRVEERFNEDLDNFSFWNDSFKAFEKNGNCAETVQPAEDSSNVDTIDNNELQLVEEVLRDLGENKEREIVEQPAHRRPARPDKIPNASTNANFTSYRNNSDVSRISYETSPSCNPIFDYRIPNIGSSMTRDYDAIVPNAPPARNDAADGYRFTEPALPSFIAQPLVTGSSAARPVANGLNNVGDIASQLLLTERRRKQSVGEFRTPKYTNDGDDLHTPKSVANFESTPRSYVRRNSDRNIIPWPLLKLPSVKASERLKNAVEPAEVERAMEKLLKLPPEDLAKQDSDGYTMLMCLVSNPANLVKKIAFLAPLVERTPRDVLTHSNNRGEDALYLAALNCPQYSYVAGYLAATMLQKSIDVSQQLYNTRGNTLVHLVAGQGDSHAEIMAELLALRTVQGNRVFDLSKRNYDGKTALHVAIESHEPVTKKVSSVATVKLLLKCGADPRVKERKCGDSALHMAISLTSDPTLVKVLLDEYAADLVNAVNYNHDTPLHAAATVSSNVPVEKQRELFWLLIQAGGQTNLSNRQGKVPLALVSPERKSLIKKVIYKRS